MKIVTPRQMNEIDGITINRFGIPGVVLMENAALKVVEETIRTLGSLTGKNILVFAGKGNNGGDAFAAARHFYNKGASVKVYTVCKKDDIGGDARINFDILDRMGLKTTEVSEAAHLHAVTAELAFADIVVDGIFGTGLRGGITGLPGDLIKAINDSHKTILSIDIPSGVNGATGEAAGVCIRANKTVTFGLPKLGMVVHPGCEYAGELVVADIGIPGAAVDSLGVKTHLIDRDRVAAILPRREVQSNKGNYGKILIVTGSAGMTGAGCLAARAALRTGAGLVYLGVPARLTQIYDTLSIESVTLPLADREPGILSRTCIRDLLELSARKNVIAIGPGLSSDDDIFGIVREVIANSKVPLVLDADALNVLAKDVSMLKNLKTEAVVTPHPGEMARLAGTTIEKVQNKRLETAQEFAARWGVTTVLKGAGSIVAAPDGTIYINPTGNPGMATGGSGDVLTGVIAALIGQGLKVPDAAAAGVYIHGLAGDFAAADKGEHGMIAGDLAEELPYVIKQLAMKN